MDCSFDYSLISHPLYITALSSHVISSIFTLISATLVLLICKNTHALNGSIRVQLYTLFFFTFLHSIVLGSFQLFHLIRDQIFSTRNDCSILLPSSFCCLFRIPFAFSIAGLVLCWFSCAIDRCIASIFPKMRDSRLEFTAKGLVSMTANKTNFVDPMLYVVIDMHCYVVPYFTICLPFLFALMVWRGKRIRRGRIATMVGEKRDGRAGAEAHFSAMEIMWKSRVSIGGNGWENEEKKRKKPFEKIRVISARP
ncbi:unnamed protein product, partial [Mesorhabditis belari]|uniref:Uncharacterized protein n=1 Tax=Mesorhabditis belari TaxID=2138241 RepID=A0AAF3ECR6_9BILA